MVHLGRLRELRQLPAGDATDHTKDRVTKYVYNNAGLLTQQIALDANGDGALDDNQVTTYIYALDLASQYGGSPVPNGSLLRAVIYPESDDTVTGGAFSDGTDDTYDRVETACNAAGLALTSTDQRGVVRTYSYDDLGRLTMDAATTIPTGVDDFVKSVTYAYDDLGRTQRVTSWANADGTGTIRADLVYEYDGWGNVATAWQSHSGAAVTSGENESPHVHYVYDDGASGGVAKYVRLSSVTYPDGNRTVTYNYPADNTVGGVLSRLDSISYVDGTTKTAAQYTYLGAGTVVQVDHPAVTGGLTLSYGANRTYAGWDRFGRVVEQTWTVDSSAVDSYGYGYDRGSNRLYRENLMNAALSELYAANDAAENEAYDGLGRMKAWSRGTLDTAKDSIASPSYYQSFTLDTLGNWAGLNDNGASQDRTTNAANEITAVGGSGGANWVDPTYDAAGNMTLAPMPGDEANAGGTRLRLTYDAWNRLVKVESWKDADSDGEQDTGEPWGVAAEYRYDGQGRRIAKTVGETTTHFFYNESWQVLETRVGTGTNPLDQYVWSARYIDSPVLRDKNTDTDGLCDDERLYYTTDANQNVTALVDTSGAAVERYVYDPYGKVTIYDGSWTNTRAASSYSNAILYCGYYRDGETGLYHVRNRVYNTAIGGWAQRDPLGYVDGMSLYEYCASAPCMGIDPLGLEWTLGGVWDGARAVAGAVGQFGMGVFEAATGISSLPPPGTQLGADARNLGHGVAAAGGAYLTARGVSDVIVGGTEVGVGLALTIGGGGLGGGVGSAAGPPGAAVGTAVGATPGVAAITVGAKTASIGLIQTAAGVFFLHNALSFPPAQVPPGSGGGSSGSDGANTEKPKKATSRNQMQKQVERGQAPKEVSRVDPAHSDGGQPHVHYKDGTASNVDGTPYHGAPNPSNATREWLENNGWKAP